MPDAATHGSSGSTEPAIDDAVIAFQTVRSGVAGRIVRLGSTVDEILTRHDYPEPVSRVLGEALVLAALLGSQIKFDGRLILQTKTDGPVGFVVVHYDTAGSMRGYASFDAERLSTMTAGGVRPDEGSLLGAGHLAMTIDPGGDMERYQGIVGMNHGTLSDAALEYFRASEQLPTFIHLAVARHFASGVWSWRSGGLMVQHLTAEGGEQIPERDDGAQTGWLLGAGDDNWRRIEMLARTVEDHELLDPTLAPERLLYRLFHEEGVRASPPSALRMACRCSRETVGAFLHRFGRAELADMRDPSGGVTVTCEFCATPYLFTDDELPQ